MKAMNLQWVGRCEKSRERHVVIADLAGEHAQLLMRPLEEVVEQPELIHDLERRGMDGVAAEVAEEIGVLLQHDDLDAGAGEQEAEHHAGRSAAGDATACGEVSVGMRQVLRSLLASSFPRMPAIQSRDAQRNYWMPALAGHDEQCG